MQIPRLTLENILFLDFEFRDNSTMFVELVAVSAPLEGEGLRF